MDTADVYTCDTQLPAIGIQLPALEQPQSNRQDTSYTWSPDYGGYHKDLSSPTDLLFSLQRDGR